MNTKDKKKRKKQNSIEPIDWYFDCWECVSQNVMNSCHMSVAHDICQSVNYYKKKRVNQAFDALIVFIVYCECCGGDEILAVGRHTKCSPFQWILMFGMCTWKWYQLKISGWTARLRNEISFINRMALGWQYSMLLTTNSSEFNGQRISIASTAIKSNGSQNGLFLVRCK